MENTSAELLVCREASWKVCEPLYEAFEKCKLENGDDPEKCLHRSIAVLGCATKVMKQIEKHCKKELEIATKCCEENNNQTYKCENEEAVLNNCFLAHSASFFGLAKKE